MDTIQISGGKRSKKKLLQRLNGGLFRQLIIRIDRKNEGDLVLYYQFRKDIDISRFRGIQVFYAEESEDNMAMRLPEKFLITSDDQNLLDFEEFLDKLEEEKDYYAYQVYI